MDFVHLVLGNLNINPRSKFLHTRAVKCCVPDAVWRDRNSISATTNWTKSSTSTNSRRCLSTERHSALFSTDGKSCAFSTVLSECLIVWLFPNKLISIIEYDQQRIAAFKRLREIDLNKTLKYELYNFHFSSNFMRTFAVKFCFIRSDDQSQ